VKVVPDTVAPVAPTLLAVSPALPSNDNHPLITGSGAEAESTIKLYDNPDCSGSVYGSGVGADFNSTGVAANVLDDTTTNFYATDTDPSGNISPCSTTTVKYVEFSHLPPVAEPPALPTPPSIVKATNFSTSVRALGTGSVTIAGLAALCGAGPCTVTGTLKALIGKKTVLLASMSTALSAEAATTPIFKLSKSKRKLLRRKKRLNVQLDWTVTSVAAPQVASGSESFRLLRPHS
jgi:hypothetical protein